MDVRTPELPAALDKNFPSIGTQTEYTAYPTIEHRTTDEAVEKVLAGFDQLNRRSPLFRNHGEAYEEIKRTVDTLHKFIGAMRSIVYHYTVRKVSEGQKKAIK